MQSKPAVSSGSYMILVRFEEKDVKIEMCSFHRRRPRDMWQLHNIQTQTLSGDTTNKENRWEHDSYTIQLLSDS